VREIIQRPVGRLAVLMSGFGQAEYRQHPRAKVKCPVVMRTAEGLVDGQTQNVSSSGAFICCARVPTLDETFRLVIAVRERLIPVSAKLVWSEVQDANGRRLFRGMGIRFTDIISGDRLFLRSLISHHL
jgi:hypothetical protein